MAKPFLQDTFTDTDAVLLENHTGEKGATWTKHPLFTAGSMDIRSNRVRCVTASSIYYASAIPYTADYDVEGILREISGGRRFAIYGRLDTALHTGYAAIYSTTTGTWELRRFVNNGGTELGTFTQALADNTSYRVKLKMRGTSISLYVDDVLRIGPITDSSVTAKGRPGVQSSQSSPATTGTHLDSITATDKVVVAKPMVAGFLDTSATIKVCVDGAWVTPNIHQVTAPGTAAWNGDGETGNTSQWTSTQLTDSDSCKLQQTTRRFSSGYAYRYQIDPGENAGIAPSDRDRAELVLNAGTTQGIPGRECWYGWSTLFPNGGLVTGEHINPSNLEGVKTPTNIFTQWHEPAPTWNIPNVRFFLDTGTNNSINPPKLIAKIAGGGTFPNQSSLNTYTLASAVEYDVWYDFVFHVLWQADATGFVEIWAGQAGATDTASPLTLGSPTVAKALQPTLFPGASYETAYLKQGFYKDHNSPTNLQSIIYHDETKLGNSFAAVVPTA